MDKTIYYPYNESFKYYGLPKAGKRAQQFVNRQNELKGGHWVLHTKEQYDEWFARKGQHIRDLEVLGLRPHCKLSNEL